MRRFIFTVSITCISRALVLRDRLLGRLRSGRIAGDVSGAVASRHTIRNGNSVLDAVFVTPASTPAQSVVLICHGIGEIVEHWLPVQRLLAAHGAASLVFDYSGYGRSTGRIDPTQCEEDAIAAFEYLQRLMPSSSVSVLGFSLGSGVAAAMITRVAAHRLVLCAAFTSFRAAAHSWGVPRRFVAVLPHIWRAEEALRDYSAPVLIVHGEQDRLFPVQMAEDLAACCAAGAVLLVVPELSHDQPFYRPHISYWGPILSHLAPQDQDLGGQEI